MMRHHCGQLASVRDERLQEAAGLAKSPHACGECAPACERIRPSQHVSLRNQMVRASASIPTNIVEGSRQASRRDFGRFLGYALNSASELEYHLMLSRDIGITA